MQTEPLGAGGAIPRPLLHIARMAALAALVAALLPVPVRAEAVDVTRPHVGTCSWYGRAFRHHRTASGERFDPELLTGAHRSFPLGSKVLVTNLRNGRS